jgi:hypothetical protein
MMHWLYNEFTKITTVLIALTQWIVHYEDIIDRFSQWLKLDVKYERRHTMKYLKLIPLLEKLATDLEAAAKSSEDQAVITDIRALIDDIKSIPTPPPADIGSPSVTA